MALLDHQHFYLVGIKGVAMTALAQCLIEAGKSVAGSDTPERFVTQPLLDKYLISVDETFSAPIPSQTDCVIYTAAHQGVDNPQVQAAAKLGIPTLSHAVAVADLCNQKQGVAVSGVGGKSTTSAMVAWILQKTDRQPSFAIGVGNIPGLDKTGQWIDDSNHFVVEADEYAANPTGVARGEELIPRFSYLKPMITVCTNLSFDHPDVYRDFAQTQAVYLRFFENIKTKGTVIINQDDSGLLDIVNTLQERRPDIQVLSFGTTSAATAELLSFSAREGETSSQVRVRQEQVTLRLQIPGRFNVMNALAALLVTTTLGVPLVAAASSLESFRSTMRRAESIGQKNGVRYYDDYAHHPHEVQQIIAAFREWFPDRKLVIAFQSHTFSRTKALFSEFAQAFNQANEVCMIDIFPSAREAFDASVTSDLLCQAIVEQAPQIQAHNFGTLANLAAYLKSHLGPGDVCISVGAGDIYQVHELI